MIFTQQDIDELKVVYLKTTGKKLTDAEAWEMATRMLRLLALLTSPPEDTVRAESNLTESASPSTFNT